MDSKTYKELLKEYEENIQSILIPASTVVLLRDKEQENQAEAMEVLLVKRSPELKFVGGTWVFPGGKVDKEDFGKDGDLIKASATACVREVREETSLDIGEKSLVRFSHWVPPPFLPRLFATWFFLAPAPEGKVIVDEGEICEYEWLTPAAAIAKRNEGEMELAPPTFITLNELTKYDSTSQAVADTASQKDLPFYATRIVTRKSSTIALWEGDAGYESQDPDIPGRRHRLEISRKIWELDITSS